MYISQSKRIQRVLYDQQSETQQFLIYYSVPQTKAANRHTSQREINTFLFCLFERHLTSMNVILMFITCLNIMSVILNKVSIHLQFKMCYHFCSHIVKPITL